jgi:hypothetical protein
MISDELERADCDVAEMMVSILVYAHMAVFICLVVLTILKNIKVNGKGYPIYYGKNNVPNHQPV